MDPIVLATILEILDLLIRNNGEHLPSGEELDKLIARRGVLSDKLTEIMEGPRGVPPTAEVEFDHRPVILEDGDDSPATT